jgi:uncharacterized OB-fold protein
MNSNDWTQGGDHLHYQQCGTCANRWYFKRDFCPTCGKTSPNTHLASGLGKVCASTLVHRAPSDEFRAIVPYRIVMVDLADGIRVMGHAEVDVLMDDQVRCEVRTIAGRSLPYFVKDTHVS